MSKPQGTGTAKAKTRPADMAWFRRTSVRANGAVVFLVVVCATLIFGVTIQNSLRVPAIERPRNVVYLHQNWTDEQRRDYYHTAQGSYLVPYTWFLALELLKISLKRATPFRNDAYMAGFGFIPDVNAWQNPDGLPVGFTRDDRFVDPHTRGRRALYLGSPVPLAIRENSFTQVDSYWRRTFHDRSPEVHGGARVGHDLSLLRSRV